MWRLVCKDWQISGIPKYPAMLLHVKGTVHYQATRLGPQRLRALREDPVEYRSSTPYFV